MWFLSLRISMIEKQERYVPILHQKIMGTYSSLSPYGHKKHWKQQATIPCFSALENQIMLCVLGTQVPLLTYIRDGLARDLELKMAKICNHANAYQTFLEDFHFDLFSELKSCSVGVVKI